MFDHLDAIFVKSVDDDFGIGGDLLPFIGIVQPKMPAAVYDHVDAHVGELFGYGFRHAGFRHRQPVV